MNSVFIRGKKKHPSPKNKKEKAEKSTSIFSKLMTVIKDKLTYVGSAFLPKKGKDYFN
jgi:hypothetical protein